MKILMCGKNNIAKQVALFLAKVVAPENLLCVYIVQEQIGPDSILETLKQQHINSKGISNGAQLEDVVTNFAPDLIYSIQFSIIFKKNILQNFEGRIVNLHNSFLPFYRGVAPISHAIMRGDKTFGVTIHLIDEGIDTGPILAQAQFPIENLTNKQVYALCEQHGLRLITQHHAILLEEIAANPNLFNLAKPQDNKNANYFPRGSFPYDKTLLNFDQTANEVYQQYLAYTFPETLYPTIIIDGRVCKVINLRIIDSLSHSSPGTFEIQNDTVKASTFDYFVEFGVM